MALLNLTAVTSCGFTLPSAAYATNQKSVVLLFYLIYTRRVQYYIPREEKIDRVSHIVNIFLGWLPPP